MTVERFGGRGWRLTVMSAQIIAIVLLLIPMIWLYVSSFRGDFEIRAGLLGIHELTLDHYRRLFDRPIVLSSFRNSFIVAAVSSTVTTIVALMAAYAISRFRFRGRGAVAGSIMGVQLIPAIVVLVPMVVILRSLGLANSLVGLTLAHLTLGLPVAVFLLTSYIDDIPPELEEAAMVDGASRVRALFSVVLPLLRPAIVAVGSFAFILSWGEYLVALSLITSEAAKTLPLGIQSLFDLYEVRVGEVLAFGVVISLPVAALFILVQRQLVEGLLAGGSK